MQTARDRIAHQLGTLILSNAEQAAHIEHLTEQLQAAQQSSQQREASKAQAAAAAVAAEFGPTD